MTDLIDLHLTALLAQSAPFDTTVRDRGRLLRCLDRELPKGVEGALPEELQAWLAHASWASKTRETYWCHIVAFYRWCVGGKIPRLDYDPSAELRRPRVGRRVPRVATDAQLAHALARLGRPALRVVILAAALGMRAGETAVAEREHATEARMVIHGKGDKMRVVPMAPDAWEEIAGCPPGRLVLEDGEPVDARRVSRIVCGALDAAGLPELSAHWFRGSYATRLRRAGADPYEIARLLGHAHVNTTMPYVDLDDADLAAAVAKLPRLPM